MNMASIWELPVVFARANKQYAGSTCVDYSIKIKDLSMRAQSYGMRALRVDGFDVVAVFRAAKQAVELARGGHGPTLLVTECYRLDGHYSGEPQVYRTREEVEEWRKCEPIPKFRNELLQKGVCTQVELDSIHDEILQEIDAAVQFARSSHLPDPATALDYIYAD
jgi:pyruvate dehydrogenase E1 component alpha subunit